MKTTALELADLRSQIDALNDEFVALVSRRALVAEEIAEVKRRAGLGMHDPERERTMRARLVAKNPGPLADDALAHLLEELFRSCRGHMERVVRRHRAAG